MQLTQDQQRVVQARGKDILVSAAAGSGKTAVLVQRILSKITDKEHPVDIDRMLIVTFTNAAAAEMRERIHAEIIKRLEEDPKDENLQRQSSLIHNAQITTIDSFCLFLLRNHFHEIGLDPGFRVADPGEIKLMEKEALSETIEYFYEQMEQQTDLENPEIKEQNRLFLRFFDAFAPDGKDGGIEEMIEQLYHCSMAHPWPEQWLSTCEEELSAAEADSIWNTQWMNYLWEVAGNDFADIFDMMETAKLICSGQDGPHMYLSNIEQDIVMLKNLTDCGVDRAAYETVRRHLSNCQFGRLSTKRDASVAEEKKERVKELRQLYKDMTAKLRDDLFVDSSEKILEKERQAAELILTLIRMTRRYIEILSERKREKNLVDFSDAEHMALNVLWQNGELTKTAFSYRDYYEEVMIDEYQDSNMVQEILLGAVAKKDAGCHNRFMVGDMKQSIYKFRLARPEIFMEKYDAYKEDNGDNELICLKKNFRSRKEVLDSANAVFEKIMRMQVGGIAYDADAALYQGMTLPSPEGGASDLYRTEICLMDKEEMKAPALRQAEARMIAQKIKSMVGRFPVADNRKLEPVKEGEPAPMRMASYKDIVILIRSEKNAADIIRKELSAEGIPVHVGSREGYFSAQEVSMLMDFLRVLNNPYDDIALCSALKSIFFGRSDEWLCLLRSASEQDTLYGCLQEMAARGESGSDDGSDEEGQDVSALYTLALDAAQIMNTIQEYRNLAVVCSMTQLVNRILKDFQYTEYVTAMPAGQQRKANVEMFVEKTVDFEKTSMHGLFHFIRYMEQLKKYKVEFGEAATLSEAADVVRIMTIHKSKGLEFPICFVACMDKKFNMEDLKKSVLIDADWGISSDYINTDSRVRGKTLKKKLLAIKMKREAIGEELRVLYVAMTRAKEKLILTGGIEKPEEKLQKYEQLLEGRGQIPVAFLAGAGNMLELVLMAYAMDGAEMQLTVTSPLEQELGTIRSLMTAGEKKEKLLALSRPQAAMQDVQPDGQQLLAQEEAYQGLKRKFSFRYPYENLAGLCTKTSVSELKKAAMEEIGLHPAFETDDREEPYIPTFMQNQKTMGGTDRGSAVHRFLELLDFTKYADAAASYDNEEMLEKDLAVFVETDRMTPEYADLVSLPRIAAFLQSDAAHRMMRAAEAGKLRKEQPFVLALSADRLNEKFPKEERVLIQGIIDVYFEEDGQIVILDYKTDRVQTMDELYKRYEAQLNYYEEAVNRISGKQVKEKIIYSFALGKETHWK